MEFLQNLSEAKLFNNSRNALKRYNAKDISELLFLHICALQIMKNEFLGLPEAQDYIKRAGNLVNFDYYIQSRNEIYILIHVLVGKQAAMQQNPVLHNELDLIMGVLGNEIIIILSSSNPQETSPRKKGRNRVHYPVNRVRIPKLQKKHNKR